MVVGAGSGRIVCGETDVETSGPLRRARSKRSSPYSMRITARRLRTGSEAKGCRATPFETRPFLRVPACEVQVHARFRASAHRRPRKKWRSSVRAPFCDGLANWPPTPGHSLPRARGGVLSCPDAGAGRLGPATPFTGFITAGAGRSAPSRPDTSAKGRRSDRCSTRSGGFPIRRHR